jgi:hypothetical protein
LTGRVRLLWELAILVGVVIMLGFGVFAAQGFLFLPRAVTTDIARLMDIALGPRILRQVEFSHLASICWPPDLQRSGSLSSTPQRSPRSLCPRGSSASIRA